MRPFDSSRTPCTFAAIQRGEEGRVELDGVLHHCPFANPAGHQPVLHKSELAGLRLLRQLHQVGLERCRFYVDLAAWGYIALVVIIFLVCKLAFLMFAWRHPERYLKFKEVI